ncbi:longitudinals lacking protein-like [Lycorma delicatula]|uniref:longitudinals lacking protein-like n=1 Tax=Lycorma delicatula TaxID=130591 RepID=UPI003F50D6FD
MGSGQQFNLRWNNHTNNILQVFMEHLNSELLVDVSLSCEGKFLKAHKMVLSACSPYFQELFKLHQLPHPVIIFNGIGFSELKLVVEFMYRGEIKVLESDLQTVLQTAEALQVKGLSTVRNKYDEAAAAAAISQHQQQQLQQQQQLFKVVSSNVDCSNTNSNTTTVSNNTNGNSAVAASANPSCTDVGSGLSHFAKTIKPVTDPFKTRTRLHKIVQACSCDIENLVFKYFLF